MISSMESTGFGACTDHGECEKASPNAISVNFIAQLNRDYLCASLRG